MSAPSFVDNARELARPFTQYVVTVAFAAGMFFRGVPIEALMIAAGLVGWHGYLRSQDKRAGVDGVAESSADGGSGPAQPAS